MTLRQFRQLLFALAFVSPGHAKAFGSEGHHIVATIAERQLSDRARSEVARLLTLEPGATLASISTWADDTRTPSTAAWHDYDAARDCPDGRCVVGAIERQRKVLASAASDFGRGTNLHALWDTGLSHSRLVHFRPCLRIRGRPALSRPTSRCRRSGPRSHARSWLRPGSIRPVTRLALTTRD